LKKSFNFVLPYNFKHLLMHKNNKRKVYKLSTLGVPRCNDFGHYQYNTIEPELTNHFHENVIEICFCIKGQQYYQVENSLYKLSGNDILIIPPNTIHSTGFYPEDIGELYWLQISLDANKGSLCNLPFSQSDYLLRRLLLKEKMIFKGNFSFRNILKSIELELLSPVSVLRELKINHQIIELLLLTLNFAEKEQLSHLSVRIETINTFIEKNKERSIYVDELANLLNLSTAYFKTWFKENVGVSPKDYINRKKIAQAKVDLKHVKNVTKVAYNLGFGSSQYFATVFKKYTGTSPSRYIRS